MKRFFAILLCLMLITLPALAEGEGAVGFTIDLTDVIVAVLMLAFDALLAWVARSILPEVREWLMERTSESQRKTYYEVVEKLVEAAEQIIGRGFGDAKFDYVANELERRGLIIDREVIEAAVKEMNDRALLLAGEALLTDYDPQAPADVEPELQPETVVIPDPVVYRGSGDDVIEITPPDGAYVFQITGNAEGRHFSVTSYSENGEYLDLLVNTTDAYSGITLDPYLKTSLLEISATGEWEVILLPTDYLPLYTSGDVVSGFGDDVFYVDNIGKTAEISGNANGRHFAVETWGENSTDLLINTTDPYTGKVLVKSDAFVFIVSASDSWEITLS